VSVFEILFSQGMPATIATNVVIFKWWKIQIG